MDVNDVDVCFQELKEKLNGKISDDQLRKELNAYINVYHVNIEAAKRGIIRKYGIATPMVKAVNFGKTVKAQKRTDPSDIYDSLDRQSDAGPMRPGQEEVLKKWYCEYKDQKNVIIKMSTGEGKTLVGLLILQSKINLDKGPCVYICPDNYLVKQVCKDANKFGIPICIIDPNGNIPDEFLSGEKILVTNVYKIFNGMTIFDPKKRRGIHIESMVIDDSHACTEIIRSSFTIEISRTGRKEVLEEKEKEKVLFESILTLFEVSLDSQGSGSLSDIKSKNKEALMIVPYWTWCENKENIIELLSKNSDLKSIKFAWPLIKDCIDNCSCYISEELIEITYQYPRISYYDIFNKISHRVFMSATVQDDSYSIKFLNMDENTVKNPLISSKQKSQGERMVIMPSKIMEDVTREFIVSELMKHSNQGYGVVVITPSFKTAEIYEKSGALIAKENIESYVERLKNGHFETPIVFANRYDGIDLPDLSCRVLVIDSMPYSNYLSDRYEEICRPESEIINKKLAQKIEQGMGRGVRREKDYCVIIIVGKDLVEFISNKESQKYFSIDTRKQIIIGKDVANQTKISAEENGYEDILFLLARQCIDRDIGWKEYYSEQMSMILEENKVDICKRYVLESDIEKEFIGSNINKAISKLQTYINEYCEDNPSEKGWYLQQMARFYYANGEKSRSIDIQRLAYGMNNKLLKPNVVHSEIEDITNRRIENIKKHIKNFSTPEKLIETAKEMMKKMSFGSKSKDFESAVDWTGKILGYDTRRPDNESGKGPDNIWKTDKERYMIIECKNEVKEDRSCISKHEAGQILSSIEWSKIEYGKNCYFESFIIIPTNVLGNDATLNEDDTRIRIIRKKELENLKKNILEFLNELIPMILKISVLINFAKSLFIINLQLMTLFPYIQ